MGVRILAGIAGWLSALFLLALANLAGFLGIVNNGNVTLISAVALVGGLILGGAVTGWAATSRGANGTSPFLSIFLAVGLYCATLLGVVLFALRAALLPPVIAVHPVRTYAAVLVCGFILGSIALVVSAMRPQDEIPAPAPSMNAQAGRYGDANRSPRGSGPYGGSPQQIGPGGIRSRPDARSAPSGKTPAAVAPRIGLPMQPGQTSSDRRLPASPPRQEPRGW